MALLILSLIGCNATNLTETEETKTTEATIDGRVEVPNPFIKYDSVEDAIEHVDFKVKLPNNIPEGYELVYICVI